MYKNFLINPNTPRRLISLLIACVTEIITVNGLSFPINIFSALFSIIVFIVKIISWSVFWNSIFHPRYADTFKIKYIKEHGNGYRLCKFLLLFIGCVFIHTILSNVLDDIIQTSLHTRYGSNAEFYSNNVYNYNNTTIESLFLMLIDTFFWWALIVPTTSIKNNLPYGEKKIRNTSYNRILYNYACTYIDHYFENKHSNVENVILGVLRDYFLEEEDTPFDYSDNERISLDIMWSQLVEYLSTGNCRISESELSPVGKVIKVFLFKLLNKQLKEGYITTVQYNENVNKLTSINDSLVENNFSKFEETNNETDVPSKEITTDANLKVLSEELTPDIEINKISAIHGHEKTKKEKKAKTKYCKCCGSIIDIHTKQCTGCGKKYFNIHKFIKVSAIAMIAALIIGSASLNIVQYINNKNLEKQIDTKQAAIEQFEKQITDFESRIEASDKAKDYYITSIIINKRQPKDAYRCRRYDNNCSNIINAY